MSARARPLSNTPAGSATRQSGFSLIEVSMALVLLGAMSLGALQVQQFQQTVEGGRQAGLRLAELRDGVARYVRDHSADLLKVQAAPQSTCANVALSVAPSAGTPPPRDCELKATAGGKPLAVNALQPSLQELQDLGYITFSDTLPFPHGNTIVDGRTGEIARARWAVSVKCKAKCLPVDGQRPAATFEVMLYNTQPFFAQADLPFGYGAQLKAALQALGPDAMVSLPGESPRVAAQLRGKGALPVDNPLRGDSADTGVPGVLASFRLIHLDGGATTAGLACGVPTGATGPGASGSACRDGSATPTDRWDFDGHDLVGVGHLAAAKAKIAGTLQVDDTVHANGGMVVRHPQGGRRTLQGAGGSRDVVDPAIDIHGHAVVRKRLMVGHNSHWDFAGQDQDGMSLSGVLVTTDGYIDTASGQAGGPGFDSRLNGIRIPRRDPDTPCNAQDINPKTSGGNIALYQPYRGQQVYVMACNREGKWVKATGG